MNHKHKAMNTYPFKQTHNATAVSGAQKKAAVTSRSFPLAWQIPREPEGTPYSAGQLCRPAGYGLRLQQRSRKAAEKIKERLGQCCCRGRGLVSGAVRQILSSFSLHLFGICVLIERGRHRFFKINYYMILLSRNGTSCVDDKRA